MKAIILAGGKGTRLKPYSTCIPKPLVPIGNRSIIEILISRLEVCDVNEIVLCVNSLSELIMAYIGNGKKFGLKIEYSVEKEPLNTVGPLSLLKNLPENFLVMNGDLLTDLDFKKLYQYHLSKKALITVATYTRKICIDFGVLEVDWIHKTALAFKEKPNYDVCVSMGVYAFNKKVLNFIPKQGAFGFDDLMDQLLKTNQKINIYPYEGYWLDIGRPADYEKANIDIENLDL